MSAPTITLHADNGGWPIIFRSAAIDVVQPVMMGDLCRYTNVQVGPRTYQVLEKPDEIQAKRAAAEGVTP